MDSGLPISERKKLHELSIVHYCHPGCEPFLSITRLPQEEAFAAARTLAQGQGDKAFIRFSDFHNYYPRRMRAEAWLYERFVTLGGEPKTRHPLYFVLGGSDYLHDWFGGGEAIKLPLSGISSKHISFTWGDSVSKFDKPERKDIMLKEILLKHIGACGGDVERFLDGIQAQCGYIEAQLWDDAYCPLPKELTDPSL